MREDIWAKEMNAGSFSKSWPSRGTHRGSIEIPRRRGKMLPAFHPAGKDLAIIK